MPLSVVLFSLIGGAYAIMYKRKATGGLDWLGWSGTIVGSIILIGIASITAMFTLPVLVVFAIIALQRVVQMLSWTAQIGGDKPELQDASRPRLVLSAIGLLSTYIGLNAMIFAFGFPEARYKHETARVRGNMRCCQVAAESYSADHSSLYPKSIGDEQFKGYFPGGVTLANPVTGSMEWAIDGKVTNVSAAREQLPGPMPKGIVEYSAILNGAHQPVGYAIRGGDSTGRTVTGTNGKPLVFSNQ